mmetsp:Transcript_21115/g.58515  ORF Transcript_21115/g.58515 Transcript_21115/m.58515 type:complete len:242 (-) Transcript_21115:147-872(-)
MVCGASTHLGVLHHHQARQRLANCAPAPAACRLRAARAALSSGTLQARGRGRQRVALHPGVPGEGRGPGRVPLREHRARAGLATHGSARGDGPRHLRPGHRGPRACRPRPGQRQEGQTLPRELPARTRLRRRGGLPRRAPGARACAAVPGAGAGGAAAAGAAEGGEPALRPGQGPGALRGEASGGARPRPSGVGTFGCGVPAPRPPQCRRRCERPTPAGLSSIAVQQLADRLGPQNDSVSH